jgi:hypothetical protein
VRELVDKRLRWDRDEEEDEFHDESGGEKLFQLN